MQIVSGDITRDITGEIVYLKAYKQMVGEVTEYSTSKNTATVKLCDTGLEITVSLDDIESTGSTQPHRAFNVVTLWIVAIVLIIKLVTM